MRETIYYGGEIIVFNEERYVEAVYVKNGLIEELGKTGELLKKYHKAALFDLEGKTLIPGFFDAHSHYFQVGLREGTEINLNSYPIGKVKKFEEILLKIKQKAQKTEKGELIKGFGFDDSNLEDGRFLTRKDLDEISDVHPIIIRHISGHIHFLNTMGLRMLQIDDFAENPADGIFVKDVDGKVNGVIEEALDLLNIYLAKVTNEDEKVAIETANKIYSKAGITTASTGATRTLKEIDLLKWGQENKVIKSRIILNRNIALIDKLDDFKFDDMLMKGTGKTYQDGSIQGYTGYLTKPYFKVPKDKDETYRGYPMWPKDELIKTVKAFHDRGEQVYIHGNGDAAIDDILDAFEECQTKNPVSDARHVVIHSQMAREDQLDRMKKLGVIPSFYILHTYYWGDRHVNIFMGPDRAMRMSPCKSALDRGIIFTLHSDSPVVPMEPLKIIWSAVNRLSTTGRVIGEKQKISVEDALKASTLNSAYQYKLEDVLGSIEKGKFADFVVLSENIYKCDPLKIKDIEILKTIVNDEVIYSKD
ncbi:MAG: amidohydrolase [Cetobacterium sp.]|uniref:amidohydrolase n=1 Tax=Cetobacterium sp. TaxID=2071632 RepID=UPI003F2F6D1E